ncbi:MAG TPA: hypothetical protein VIA06_21415 [Candidatus Dormibacteraeota bacterium]|jgi:hypothetical protein|nr:hypothetical protein [Candidatus Dormibacteraeota bacterium]
MPSPTAARREHAALRGTQLRLGLTAFIIVSVYAVAIYQAVAYWRVTHDPGRAEVTARLVQCSADSSGACQARFRYGGRSYLVGPVQGREGQQATLSIERADPTSFRNPGGAADAYGPIVAAALLTLGALVWWRLYRPGAGPRAPMPGSE